MSELTEFRRAKDDFLKGDHHSPLTDDQRPAFHSLSYYTERPDLRLLLDLEPFEAEETVEMQTSTGDVASYLRWGRASFQVDSEPAQLTIYKDTGGDDLFLPFADATSGDETYGAGRYLDVKAAGGGQVLLDFNYAYNPYCAYNERWSCPITPPENRIKVAIRAGEKSFK